MVAVKREAIIAMLSLIVVIVTSYLALSIPIERILSHSGYPWIREYPWYFYWRVALANLILWLIALLLLSLDINQARYLALLTAITFTMFHYALLKISKGSEYSVRITPLVYIVHLSEYQHETIYLDLGQIVILVTIANMISWKTIVKKIKRYLS